MRLAFDGAYPTALGGHCRVRAYLPDYEGKTRGDAPVVLLTEPADNPGMSVTNAAQVVAVEVLATQRLLPPVIFVEHYEDGSGGTAEDPHTFDLLTFSRLRVMEHGPEVRGLRYEIGAPDWKPLDRATVEALIGGPLDRRRWQGGGPDEQAREQGLATDGRPQDGPRGAAKMGEPDQNARRPEQRGRRYRTRMRMMIDGEPDRVFDLFGVPVSITRFEYVSARAIGPFSAEVPDGGIERTEEGRFYWWYGDAEGLEDSFGAASRHMPWLRMTAARVEEQIYVRETGEEEWRRVPDIDVVARPGEPAVDVEYVRRVVEAYPEGTDHGRLQDAILIPMMHPIQRRLETRYLEYFATQEGRRLTAEERREVLDLANRRTIEVLFDEMEPAWEAYWTGRGEASAEGDAR